MIRAAPEWVVSISGFLAVAAPKYTRITFMPITLDEPEVEERLDYKLRYQPPYHVILVNVEDHSYAYVITMLKELFGFEIEKGFELATEVDEHGRAVILTTTREHAELKQDQIHSYGPDPFIDRSEGSMTAVIEPAE